MRISGNKLPILCNQENFIIRGNSYLIEKALSNCHIVFKPSVKEHIEGRPKNGMFIAVTDSIKDKIRDISPPNWRLQAILIEFDNVRFLVINLYFPTDPRTIAFDEGPLQEVLLSISTLIENIEFDQFFLCGDINSDFIRNSDHVKTVNRFLNELNLVKAWEIYNVDFTLKNDSEFHRREEIKKTMGAAALCELKFLRETQNARLTSKWGRKSFKGSCVT